MSDETNARQAPPPAANTAMRGRPVGSEALTVAVRDLLMGGESPATPSAPASQAEPRGAELQQQQAPADPGREPEPGAEMSEDGLGLQPTPAPGGDSATVPPAALQHLAEQAGITIDQLYAVKIPLGDGREPVTLGSLKDNYSQFADFTDQRDTFEETRTTFENDILRARAELQEVINLLPNIPPEYLQQAAAQVQQTRQQEREALYQIRPDWRDPETFARVQDSIFDTVSDYGFSRAELDSVFDHRLTKLLFDFVTMRTRFAEANASRKRQVDDNKQGRSGTTRRQDAGSRKSQQRQQARQAARPDQKMDVIKDLISHGV